jgi:predicted HAD superfamily Cof-like phosphohydrolase
MQTLIDTINQVKQFHDVFGLPSNEKPTVAVGEKTYMLRYNLMKEENEEYLEAAQQGDLTQIADALGDKLYILCGTIIAHGLQHKIADVFNEIHRSNMSKLDADGKPIYRNDGKILKGENYFLPDIDAVLNADR